MKKQSNSKTHKKSPLFLIFIALLFADLVLLSLAVFLYISIYFISLKPVENVSPSRVHFSYFEKMPDIQAFSKALAVYDVNDKVLLLSKNQNLRFSPASTAKIMTAIIALEYYDPKTVLTVNSLPENPDSSKMGLFIGEKMSVLNLLYGMLLPSGSDAADVLALNYPGGEEAFVARMNEKASSLGFLNTYFVDPSGYDDSNYTTAYDLARLGAYMLTNVTLANIVKTPEVTVYNAENTVSYDLKNLNELLVVSGVTGIKTGFTNEAQGVLVTSFLHNGKSYIIVVLGSKDRFQDTKTLIEGIIKDLKSDSKNI